MSVTVTSNYIILSYRDQRIVFFVDIQILNDTLSKEVIEILQSKREVFNMLLFQDKLTPIANK